MQKRRKSSGWARTAGVVSTGRAHLYENRRRIATAAASALALIVGYGVIFGHNGLTVFAHKREETRVLQRQTQQLQTENERLRSHVDELQSDPAAIEHEARENLHYTRAGEVIYTLPAAPSSGSQSSGSR